MPPDLRREVDHLLLLHALNGVADKPAAKAIAELYSPPRVTAELKAYRRRCPGMGLVPGATFDLCEDEHGVAYDALEASDRQRIRERVRRDKPFLVVGSPPCTDWCYYNVNFNHKKMAPEELKRRLIEREVHLRFAAEIYCLQLAGGRRFLHEHPLGATSWKEQCIRALARVPGVGTVIGDQCQYGLKTVGQDGRPMPAKKPTRFLSSAPVVLEALSRRCRGEHRHQVLEGVGRAAAAARYPAGLCRVILRGAGE